MVFQEWAENWVLCSRRIIHVILLIDVSEAGTLGGTCHVFPFRRSSDYWLRRFSQSLHAFQRNSPITTTANRVTISPGTIQNIPRIMLGVSVEWHGVALLRE